MSNCKYVFEMILKADPSTSLLPLYDDDSNKIPLTLTESWPKNRIKGNGFIHVNNPWTLSPDQRTEENKKVRKKGSTYVYIKVLTSLDISWIINLVEGRCVSECNTTVKVK